MADKPLLTRYPNLMLFVLFTAFVLSIVGTVYGVMADDSKDDVLTIVKPIKVDKDYDNNGGNFGAAVSHFGFNELQILQDLPVGDTCNFWICRNYFFNCCIRWTWCKF